MLGCVAKNGLRPRMKFHTHRVLEESIPYWSVIRLSHPVFCSILNYSLDGCTGVNIHLLGHSIEVEIQRWRSSSSFFPLNNERPTLRKDKCCVKPRAKWSRSTFGLWHITITISLAHARFSLFSGEGTVAHTPPSLPCFSNGRQVVFDWWWGATMHTPKY